MDNKELNIVLSDLRVIIEGLVHIIDSEKMKAQHANHFMAEIHTANISHAMECKECLEFIEKTLPMLSPDFKVMNIKRDSTRTFNTLSELQKCRKELKKVHDCVKLFMWVARNNPGKMAEDIDLSSECQRKLTQANSALYKIK